MILALETSTPHASIAVLNPDTCEVAFEEHFTSDRAHNALIFQPLARALDALPGNPDWIVVGTGPGSYGGIRVGIAVANALSVARKARVIGLPSLLALPVEEDSYTVIGDARRKSYYLANIQSRRLENTPTVLDSRQLRERVTEIDSPILTTDARPPLDLPEVLTSTPEATFLARIAAKIPENERQSLAARPLEPLYIREPYITTPKNR